MKKIFSILLILLLVISCAQAAEAGLTEFSAYDVSTGYTDSMPVVTQDIFADYDITMVNIWATWCGYCVDEMPELAKLKTMLPENVNLISICDDAAEEEELVTRILTETGATNFPTLMPTQQMYDQLLNYVYSFPTTFFMDREGNAVGYITGVPSLENPAEAYLEIIHKALEMVEEAL